MGREDHNNEVCDVNLCKLELPFFFCGGKNNVRKLRSLKNKDQKKKHDFLSPCSEALR